MYIIIRILARTFCGAPLCALMVVRARKKRYSPRRLSDAVPYLGVRRNIYLNVPDGGLWRAVRPFAESAVGPR